MTKRLYYDQPDLLEFDSVVDEMSAPLIGLPQSRAQPLILRESAFYPTSGGQIHDTGWITVGGERLRVAEVVDAEDGTRCALPGSDPRKCRNCGWNSPSTADIDAAATPRSHAAALRTACAFGGVYRALSVADGFVSYG